MYINDCKITKEGFIWRLISKEDAYAITDEEIYALHSDGSETLIKSDSDITEHNGQFGIEVGFIHEIAKRYFKEDENMCNE